VVIVHGLKDHSGRYAAFAELLAREGFAVHAFDLRGHGRSEGVRVAISSFDEYTADLGIFVARVKRIERGQKVFLFGHSMGAAIVTTYLLERRPDVAGVVLSAAALEADLPALEVAGTRFIAGVSPQAGVFQLDLDDFSRDRDVVRAAKEDPLVYQEPSPARTAGELLSAIGRIQAKMEEVEVPFLVLHGTGDKVTPPSGSRALHARARSGDKAIKLYDRLAHDLLHEPEKDMVARDIVGWLAARAPAGVR
jgi:alpha-beta hydrolase superfamily lysophospholipase